ncbi:MAG: RNA methyltransferase [Smithellaceae bacterium]
MLYLALLHYPVMNKDGKIITTAIVNADIHDVARAARTYGVKTFYIVNPVEAQRKLAGEIIKHWQDGYGADFNKLRKEAFSLVRLKKTLQDVIDEIKEENGIEPKTIATTAHQTEGFLTFSSLKEKLENNKLPYLLIFGTGSGLTQKIIKGANFCLEPIRGVDNYNHLAVRSAAVVILDRIRNI